MNSRKTLSYPCIAENFINLASRGQLREAIDNLPLLLRKGVRLKSKTIAFLIHQCANQKSIKSGNLVCLHLKLSGRKRISTFLSNHLIDMYARCGDHVKAREIFDKMVDRNLFSWNTMLSGYSSLGMMQAAKSLFDRMPEEKDFISWNSMMMGYVHSGWFDEAIKMYLELRKKDIGFNEYSFAGILKVCVKLKDLYLAKQLHCQVLVAGFLSNMVLSSSIMDAYAKCGQVDDAENLFFGMINRDVFAWTILISAYSQAGNMRSALEVFDAMPQKNTTSWNVLIGGYSNNGMGSHAIKSFSEMIILGYEPDQFTYSSCLLACAIIASLELGRQFHSHVITSGLRLNVHILSSLICMYSSCEKLDIAKGILYTAENRQHIMPWNTMISALSDKGYGKEAIRVFFEMLSLGVKPESTTFVILLNACQRSGLLKEAVCLLESMKTDYNIIPQAEHHACLADLSHLSTDHC